MKAQLARTVDTRGWAAPDLSDNARRVLERRYLSRNETGRPTETPKDLFARVALNVAEADLLYDPAADVAGTAKRFYDLMARLEFLPNSPTLMNAGKDLQQLSACFVLPIEDSMEGIFRTVKDAAVIHKSGGGCIAADAWVWTTFCGLEPIHVLAERALADGRPGEARGGGIAYDAGDLDIEILSMDPRTGRVGLRRVTHVWRFDVRPKDQFEVRTREGVRIQTSAWHPFLVVRPEGLVKVRADQLRSGDVVLGPGRPDEWWPIRAPSRVGALVLDEALGWLIGFTLGDGSFGRAPALRQLRVRWFSGRSDVLERVRAVLAGLGIKVSIQRDARGLFSVSTLTQWFAKDLLAACGLDHIGPKDDRIRVPEVLTKSPLPVVRAFVAGLIDSDGTVATDGSPSYSTVSREMAEGLCALMSLLGYHPTFTTKAAWGRGKRPVHTVLLCTLPQVATLRTEIEPYLASLFRRERLHSVSRKRTALRLPFRSWRDRLRGLALVQERGRKGAGPCHAELDRWSCNQAGRCRRDDLMNIADAVASKDASMADLLRRVAQSGLEIVNVGTAPEPRPFFDLTVEDWGTYAAGRNGLTFVHNTGFSFSRLRPRGDIVFSTHGVSSGPLSFLEVLNQTTESIKQGGTRRGANMGILRVDHPDIEEFIAAKRTMGRLENFNLSVGVTERFMEELREDSDVTLRNPRTGAAVKTMRARVIWDLIAQSAWASGEPGVIFLDRINDANPTRHVAEIESTNPCGEVPLGPYEACNLGSVSLRRFVKDRGVDWPRLRRAVHDAVHFLDNIIDASRYPVREIESQTKANRRIGLGVMGFADMLSMFGVRYDSVRGEAWARRVMKFVNDEAVRASEALANERGEFANWHGSLWHKRGDKPRRNATVTTIAPTGTISMIADCSGGCEPVFALAYVKRVMEGTELVYANEVFERRAKEEGFHSERLMPEIAASGSCQGLAEVPAAVQEVFRVAYDIPWEWHVRIQAAFQSHVENAVSKTINMPASATPDDVKAAYELAYELGCKGVTVFRESSRGTAVLTKGSVGGRAASPGRVRKASGTAAPEADGVLASGAPESTGSEGVGATRDPPFAVNMLRAEAKR